MQSKLNSEKCQEVRGKLRTQEPDTTKKRNSRRGTRLRAGQREVAPPQGMALVGTLQTLPLRKILLTLPSQEGTASAALPQQGVIYTRGGGSNTVAMSQANEGKS